MARQLEEKEEELSSFQMQYMTLESEMARLSSQHKQMERQCQELESTIDDVKQERDGLARETTQRSETIAKLQEALDKTLSTQNSPEEEVYWSILVLSWR